ncbi:polysaccharide biosynthesis/export family protein [Parabacteroides chinchillae]|uniref:Polysaccharide export outer membrane protein n=1 Tax=Parabacteroides chinchillae TaxID=871327 RepID=A0A8G2BTY4_9BACT|nr:polysaccharide biosynthesis/export family protein [Parabacteroides chinchillae]SEF46508.1 polysaccharide export outer membrane protein [Parabacteroides chinchillae]
MRVKLVSVVGVVLLTLLLGSCGTPKDVIYFQGVDSLTPEQKEAMNQSYNTRIVPDDLLNITVTAWDPSVVTPFNPPTYAYSQQGDQPVFASQSLYNYLVDKDGMINFPVLGMLHVAGMTKQELSKMLEEKISKYVKDPLVNIQISNFKVTLMGEVNRPGSLTARNDRLSILDAIGQSGDLTINANRKNILIIRDENGQKEMARLDLTDPAIFASPYYYLRQNDVIYVEPNKAKKKNARYSQAQQYNITVFSSVISAVSIITSMVITIINTSKK